MEQQYKHDYEEVQCIGRGAYGKFFYLSLHLLGAAYLVIHKTEKKKYIAKQIML